MLSKSDINTFVPPELLPSPDTPGPTRHQPTGPPATRAPDSRSSWEDAVYAAGKTLPADCQVKPSTFVTVLVRWARYASWSGGRHGVNGRPAVTTLGEECGLNEKTVRRVLAAAVKAGVLVCTAQRNGGLSPAPSTYAAAVPVSKGNGQPPLFSSPIQSGHAARSESRSERTSQPFRADIAARQSGHSYVRQPHDLNTSTSSPPPEPVQAAILVGLPRGGGGGRPDATEERRGRPITVTREPEVDAACDAILTALQPSRAVFQDCHLHRSRWRPYVAEAVAAGWSADALAPAVTAGSWEGVKSPSAVLGGSRLQDAARAGPPRVTLVSSPHKRCGTHPNSGRRPDDECAGCWSDRQCEVAWA